MNKNKVSLGSWITLGHFSIAEIMSRAKFDWLCVDLEHSVISLYEAEKLISSIESNGCIPYVRVGMNDPLIFKRVLDAGANGIIIPMINNVEDAENAVKYSKYPPIGSRGVGLARAQGYGFDFENYSKNINEEIKIIAQVEHYLAIKNLDKILNVKGIDGTIIGPYDLSGSIGFPGQYDKPEVKKLLTEYEMICKKNSSPMGFHVISPDHGQLINKMNKGYTFLAFSLDTIFLGDKCINEVNLFREKYSL